MITRYKLALTAGLVLAMAFTFSCSGDDGGGTPDGISSSGDGGGSSSSDGGSSSGGSSSSDGLSSSDVSSSSGNADSSPSVSTECTSWSEWAITPATCDAEGSKTRSCTSGITKTETEAIAQLVWGDWEIKTPASGTTPAKGERVCPNGEVDTEDLAICGADKPFAPAEQFCQNGVVEELCGAAKETYTSTEFCQNGAVKPKCGTKEYTSTEFCLGGEVTSKCGGTEEYEPTHFCQAVTNKILPLCGTLPYNANQFCHTDNTVQNNFGNWSVKTPATCDAEGEETRTNGTLTETRSIPQLVWGNWSVTTAATCDAAGLETATCSNGDSKTRPITQLVWNWSVTIPATCDAAGLETATCSNGASKTRPITQLVWSNWSVTTPATCTTAGLETATCSNGASKTQSIAKLSYDNTTHLCDARDGKLYKFTVIGTQTWMAENLNYEASGSKCGSVLTGTGTLDDANTPACDTYGRLYNWSTAMAGSSSSTANPSGRQGVCPAGWHLPSDAEWTALTTFVGTDPGTKLKANSSLWSTNTGTDEFGFSALPGGEGGSSGRFSDVGNTGSWWSSTEFTASNGYFRRTSYYNALVVKFNGEKIDLYSVRCVQN